MVLLSEEFYRDILDNIDVGVYFVDRDRKIVYWNKGAERITGYGASEVLDRRCADNILVHVDDEGNALCVSMCPLACTLADGSDRRNQVYLHHKKGHRVPVTVAIAPIRNSVGEIIGAVETFRDNSAERVDKIVLQELRKAASLDPLTELLNRRFIETKIQASIEELKRHGIAFGIIFCDIDHFKDINDSYGHTAGDVILQMVARTLLENIRAHDMAARWGGEEFLLVITHVTGKSLIKIGNKLRTLVKNSFVERDGRIISVSVTMGATMAGPEDTIESLMERADGLMYNGKMSGRNCVMHDVQDVDSPS
jgi:diguanylate cyclase (GGDEF)-like protein/PAS domain S-box-containing protein